MNRLGFDRLERIIALIENPHWTNDRKDRIWQYAKEALVSFQGLEDDVEQARAALTDCTGMSEVLVAKIQYLVDAFAPREEDDPVITFPDGDTWWRTGTEPTPNA